MECVIFILNCCENDFLKEGMEVSFEGKIPFMCIPSIWVLEGRPEIKIRKFIDDSIVPIPAEIVRWLNVLKVLSKSDKKHLEIISTMIKDASFLVNGLKSEKTIAKNTKDYRAKITKMKVKLTDWQKTSKKDEVKLIVDACLYELDQIDDYIETINTLQEYPLNNIPGKDIDIDLKNLAMWGRKVFGTGCLSIASYLDRVSNNDENINL